MNTSRLQISFLGFLATLVLAGVCRAQEKTRKQIAEESFQTAVGFADEENFAAACPLLDRALELDPSERTLFALADCREHEGRIGTSLRHWRLFVTTYGVTAQPQRSQTANERIKRLESEVPKAQFVLGRGESRDTKLFIDGMPVDFDQVVELDPGEHRLIIGRRAMAREIRSVKVERGKPTEKVAIDAPDGVVDANRDMARQKQSLALAKPEDSTTRDTSNRNVGIGGVVVGGTGFLVAGILGVMALSKKGTADLDCVTNSRGVSCSPQGLAAMNEGRMLGNVATIPLAFGAAFAAAGIVFIVRNPKVNTSAGLTWTNNGTPFVSVVGRF